MNDISGFGLQVLLRASVTFPAGVPLSQFADDADPFDLPEQQIGDGAMGLNGDPLGWTTATLINLTLNVIAGSEDDKNLAILFNTNRAAKGKFVVRDSITLGAIYPDGTTITLTDGKITKGYPGKSVASAGRFKSKAYTFIFGNMVNT